MNSNNLKGHLADTSTNNNHMSRRQFIKLATAGTISAGLSYNHWLYAANKRPPNIIFIMADDLGYGHLSCYGQEKFKTPNIDRLAAEGMKFTQYYAGYTVCAPSRSVLMTGLHHGHTPVRSNSGSSTLLESETTVAQVLKKAGYTTGGFGKWGLGLENMPGVPSKKGFDEFYGFYHQVHAHFYYPYWIWHNDEKLMLDGNDHKFDQYVDDVLHEKAMDFIRTSAKKRLPFFCYIPSIIPHVELAVPEDSVKPYRGKFPKTTINDPRPGYIGSDDAYAVYAGMISRLDRNVGQIMTLLKQLNIDKNTIVFFTSDNGPQSGPWQPLRDFFKGAGPLRGSKGHLYEGGIRVPFIARWPGRIEPDSTSEHIGGFQDMMPTFAQLASVKPTQNDGISIVPTLLGRKRRQKKHEYLYWGSAATRAVRMGKWKAVKPGKKNDWELYDLSKDIGEINNLASAHPDVMSRIKQYASEAFVTNRKQIGGKWPHISEYVRGDRIDKLKKDN
ncbi:MAG: arylsulfatase [Planctomycetota bacterium]